MFKINFRDQVFFGADTLSLTGIMTLVVNYKVKEESENPRFIKKFRKSKVNNEKDYLELLKDMDCSYPKDKKTDFKVPYSQLRKLQNLSKNISQNINNEEEYDEEKPHLENKSNQESSSSKKKQDSGGFASHKLRLDRKGNLSKRHNLLVLVTDNCGRVFSILIDKLFRYLNTPIYNPNKYHSFRYESHKKSLNRKDNLNADSLSDGYRKKNYKLRRLYHP